MKKFYAVLLVFAMAANTLAGCSKGKNDRNGIVAGTNATQGVKDNYLNKEGAFPIVKEPITLTMVVQKSSNGGPVDGMWWWPWYENKTNIKCQVTSVDNTAWEEKKKVMFAANDLPDVFFQANLWDYEQTTYGAHGKLLLDLNSLIDNYAPNVRKAFEKTPEARAIMTAKDGGMYALPSLFDLNDISGGLRAFINQDWLDKLGLKMPRTIEEFYAVLKAFKAGDANGNGQPDEIPFGARFNNNYAYDRFLVLSAFGLPWYADIKNKAVDYCIDPSGKLVIPIADPRFKEYLTFMNKLYTEGLIDKDIFTQNQTQLFAKSAENKVGLLFGSGPRAFNDKNWRSWVHVMPLTSQTNDKPVWLGQSPVAGAGKFAITAKCKYPEAAIRWADYLFDEEGSVNFWYGPKAGSPDEKFMKNGSGWNLNDQKVLTYSNMKDKANTYDFQCFYVSPINGKLGLPVNYTLQKKMIDPNLSMGEDGIFMEETYRKNAFPYHMTPINGLFLDEEAQKRKEELAAPINEYVNMMEAKFIAGAEPLSNIDKYYDQLNKLGIGEIQKMYEDTYKTYQENLKKYKK